MLEKWLREGEPERVSESLEVQVLAEQGSVEKEDLYQYLGKELFRNFVAPGELEAVFLDLGLPEVADHLSRHKFPNDLKVRHGDFGEALTGAWFRRVRRWCVPILKLRYKQRPNQPVQGADVLAFRLRLTPPVVAVPEVKTRTTRNLDIAVVASESLGTVVEDLPSSFQFVIARLVDQKNSFLAARIARLLRHEYVLERHIVLVHDESIWDDRITTRLAQVEDDPTTMTIIRVGGLREIIDNSFSDAAGRPASLARDGSAGRA